MFYSSVFSRRAVAIAVAGLALASAAIPATAQMRQQMADQIATKAANSFVGKIQGENCSDFAATMAQMKQKSASGSSSSAMAAKLKANQQARTDFVNIVAAPLLNKMIDCNMLPGGM
ncbi:MAG TPA: hypothetical protein VMU38_09635 [Candidatus Binatia bacterium]|nr:hypothetical protein [Candidatus Binatia bacterium]